MFAALNDQLQGQLRVVFPDTKIPERVREKAKRVLGESAIELVGEKSLTLGKTKSQFSNSSWLFPYQPGLLRQIRALEPDVMIGDGFAQWTLPLVALRARKRAPLVLCYERTAHTERNAQLSRRMFRKLISRYVDAACVNGSLSKQYLSSLGVPDDKITTGFMASDTAIGEKVRAYSLADRAAVRKEFQVEDAFTVCCVARLIDLKGLEELLLAWNRFAARQSGVRLLIAGDGNMRSKLEELITNESIDTATLLGAVPYDEIDRLYAASDMMVMPSLEDNWSLVVPEAMSCGLPVLNSKYNGCWPELTIENETGWVFDPLNSQAYEQAFHQAYANRSEFDSMAEHCRVKVTEYSPGSAAQSILRACRMACRQGVEV